MPSMISLHVFGYMSLGFILWQKAKVSSKSVSSFSSQLPRPVAGLGSWSGRAKSRPNWKILQQVLRSHKNSIPMETCCGPFLPLANLMEFIIKARQKWKWKWKLLSCVQFSATPWNSPGQNTGVGSHSLLHGIFPIQGSNPGLLHYRQILYQLSHQGSPRILEWVAYPFSKGSS